MLKIIGVSKSEKHNYYEIEKNQEFFSGFRKLLVDLEFDEDFTILGFGRTEGEDGPIITKDDGIKDDDIKEYIDTHAFFCNDDYRIDVIFGKEKIFLIVNSEKDKQELISEKIQKFCSF